jgi:glycosyltransferase involved in cell wall biosynthesis
MTIGFEEERVEFIKEIKHLFTDNESSNIIFLRELDSFNKNDIYQLLVKKEVYAYQNASVIICPTKYSLDGYFESDCDSRAILKKVPKHTVVSTVTIPKPTLGRLKIREKFNIGLNDLAVGFIGRYSFDKGYDRFLSIARRHRNNPNIYFFSAGAGEIREDDSSVYDLGWRKDIVDIILAMDLIIIPNRVTYFDLLPIESLMLGTPVAVTAVGGNKWLLNEINDNRVLELKLDDMDVDDNLNQIIRMLPCRDKFKDAGLLRFFDDYIFINSHEALLQRIEEFEGVGS